MSSPRTTRSPDLDRLASPLGTGPIQGEGSSRQGKVIALHLRRRPALVPVADQGGTDETPGAFDSFDVASAYDAHASALLGFAVNVLRDRALAEDCVQETFLRAWRARGGFDASRGSLRTWLFAIERNVITDVHRSIGRMPLIVSSQVDDDTRVGRDSSADTVERLRIVEALAQLTPDHREVVVAVHLAGRSYTELSESTGVPAATLRTRAFYAMRTLRTHLESQEDT